MILLPAFLLSACQAVQTTSGGAVGADSDQYMFSLLSSEKTNEMSATAYTKTVNDAKSKGQLDKTSANAKRVDAVARRMIAQVPALRPDAAQWNWEVNVIDSPEINANCGPGGKIIVYTGIIETLNLNDDELAALMGHEVSHALREHGREAMSKAFGVAMAKASAGALLGINPDNLEMAQSVVDYTMTLPNSREKENEADLIGLELSARAGYNPNGAVTLWQKMAKVMGDQEPSEFSSTHPSSENRVIALQAAIPKVMPLYQKAIAK